MGKKTDLESVHLVNHSKCMMAAFQNFRQDETMLDVTLACNGQSMKAHKLVLSACSPFFKDLLAENPCSHPIIILRDFEFVDLKAVIDFIYKGELSVPRERLISALKVAEELQVRGLKRSEPSAKKYEKIYSQVCGKLPVRKKRKKHHHDSSDSEKEYLNVSESDENVETDDSLNADESSVLEPQGLDEVYMEESSVNDQDSRPVVLRVSDPAISNDDNESNSKNVDVEECNMLGTVEPSSSHTDLLKGNSDVHEGTEDEPFDSVSENAASSSQLDSFVENSNCLVDSEPADTQSGFQDQSSISMDTATSSEDQVGCISSSLCLSPESLEIEQHDEPKVHNEGKRFVCSKCSLVFTSRITFMRHKMQGHKTDKRSPIKCPHCTFSTDELDSYKNHLVVHSKSKVPYSCSTCSEEFSSEEAYNEHLSVHNKEKNSLQDLSLESRQDLFSIQSPVPENVYFRCSVCFTKFTSKLSCQLHEKTCQVNSACDLSKLLDLIDSIDPCIQFTHEECNNCLLHLDGIVSKNGSTFSASIYSKPFAVFIASHARSNHPVHKTRILFTGGS